MMMMMMTTNLEYIATEDLSIAKSTVAISSAHHDDDDDDDYQDVSDQSEAMEGWRDSFHQWGRTKGFTDENFIEMIIL